MTNTLEPRKVLDNLPSLLNYVQKESIPDEALLLGIDLDDGLPIYLNLWDESCPTTLIENGISVLKTAVGHIILGKNGLEYAILTRHPERWNCANVIASYSEQAEQALAYNCTKAKSQESLHKRIVLFVDELSEVGETIDFSGWQNLAWLMGSGVRYGIRVLAIAMRPIGNCVFIKSYGDIFVTNYSDGTYSKFMPLRYDI